MPLPRTARLRHSTQRRHRRLFLEPLEDRRLLTFGWGSPFASGSYAGGIGGSNGASPAISPSSGWCARA